MNDTEVTSKNECININLTPCSEEYLTRAQVCERLKIAKMTALHWIKSEKIRGSLLFKQTWYVPILEVVRIEQEKLSLVDYYSTQQIVKRFNCHLRTVMKLIGLNTFPNAVLVSKVWYVPEQDLIKYEEDLRPPVGFISIQEAAKILELGEAHMSQLSRQGKIPGSYKKEGQWIYPLIEIKDLLASRNIAIPQQSYEHFNYYSSDIEVPSFLNNTMKLYKNFVIIKFSASRANILNQQNEARQYARTIRNLIPLLESNIFDLTDKQVKNLFLSTDLTANYKEILIIFLNYCQGTVECKFKNKYSVADAA